MSRAGEGIYTRGSTWYFRYRDPKDGKWKEKSTEQTKKPEARKVKQAFLADLESGSLPNDMAAWTLKAAADEFVEFRKVTASAKTAQIEKSFLKAVTSVFGETRVLNTLQPHDLEKYQVTRRKAGKHPRTVNLEIKSLRQVLKRASLWQRFAPRYKELRVPRTDKGLVLLPADAKKLLAKAQENPGWKLAFYCCALAASTGLRSIEIKRLQLRDIVIDGLAPHLNIRRSKTDAGIRSVPLNHGGLVAVSWLLERSKALGASEPIHYLLPLNRSKHTRSDDPNKGRRGFDPTCHQGSWGKAWRSLRKEAGMALRFHDLRHTFITACATRGIPVAVTQSLVGHKSAAVTDIYTHVQQTAKQEAVRMIEADLLFSAEQGTEAQQ